LPTSPNAKAGEKPNPLAVIGRVTTFQNSEMFCNVKQTCSPAARRRATLSIAGA
jgi:hypothetical protein